MTPEHSEREATAMLLLKLCADYDASKIAARDTCAVVIKQYLDSVRAQVAQLQQLQLEQLDVYKHTVTTAAAGERTVSPGHVLAALALHALVTLCKCS